MLDAIGAIELARELVLFGNAPGLEVVVEVPVVVVAGEFTIAFASAGANIAMLATGLVTVMDPPLVLARLVIEPSLVFETMVSFQEINLPASPPAVASNVRPRPSARQSLQPPRLPLPRLRARRKPTCWKPSASSK